MALKFNTLKSIKQALIGPNILSPAAYLLFGAEVCSRGIPQNQPSSQINHIARSSDQPTGPFSQNKEKDISDRSVPPSTKPKKKVRFNNDVTIRYFSNAL
ncbi:hypothetical protein ACRRVB_04080 [Candidatus Cardinium hertigii]|uniref:hypothetical protein n=1 Tax=Candidatus Cardinium hertigii TaxID=247481 RepID=UPI003D7E9E17